MHNEIASKLPNVGTTIFAVMSKMANDYNAINLSQGFPDFAVSAELIGLVNKAMEDGFNQYPSMLGVAEVRQSIHEMLQHSYQVNVDPESEVTITAGATEAIFSAITAIVNPGDEVILFDPAYDCYDPAIRLSGGVPIHIPLDQPNFNIPWDKAREAISDKTRLIIVNSPQNPSGAVLTSSDLDQLEQLVADKNIFILSDEVYEHIIFDDLPHETVLKREALRAKSVVIFSFGKTFHATGWKIGYFVAPQYLTSEVRRIHQFVTFTVNTPMQKGLAQYASNPENYVNLGKFYQQKRDRFLELTKDSRLKPVPCHGTYFQLLSYEGISDLNEMEMAAKLTKENGIASIPVSVFYESKEDNQLLRFCFAKNDETLQRAAEILCKI